VCAAAAPADDAAAALHEQKKAVYMSQNPSSVEKAPCRQGEDKHGHVSVFMLGEWVNPHREQQTIPQGQTSLPPKSFSTPTANGQSAPRTGSARGVGRRGEPHTEHGLGDTHTAASMKRDRRKSLLRKRPVDKERINTATFPFFTEPLSPIP